MVGKGDGDGIGWLGDDDSFSKAKVVGQPALEL